METLYFDLRQVLEKQNRVISGMVDAAQEHNQALRNNETTGIMAAVTKQEELARSLQVLDKEREELQGRLARQLRLRGDIVLERLLSYVPGSASVKELRGLADSLRESLTQLAEINGLNNLLARRGLSFTEQLMGIIKPSCDTYAGSGELKSQDHSPAIFSTIDKTI